MKKKKLSKKEKKKREPEKIAEPAISPVKLAYIYSTREDAPVTGQGLYWVAKQWRDEGNARVLLLHPISLGTMEMSRREFETSIREVFLPLPMVPTGYVCDPHKLADNMLASMKAFAVRKKYFPNKLARKAIAELKEIPLDDVPDFHSFDNIPSGDWKSKAEAYLKSKGDRERYIMKKSKKTNQPLWKKEAGKVLRQVDGDDDAPAKKSKDKVKHQTKDDKKKSGKTAKPEKKSAKKGKANGGGAELVKDAHYRVKSGNGAVWNELLPGKPVKQKELIKRLKQYNVLGHLNTIKGDLKKGKITGYKMVKAGQDGLWQMK